MRTQILRFALISGVALALGGPIAAQNSPANTTASQTKAPKATTIHSTRGTIASINTNTLVLNQTVKGKTQQVTLNLNTETQRTGDLNAGKMVSVQYKEENNQKVATAVHELLTKSTAPKPNSKSTAKS